MLTQKPTFTLELDFLKLGKATVGVDEAGVAPLAGPVVAAAVILDPSRIGSSRSRTRWWAGVKDSKQLSRPRREELAKIIFEHALACSLAMATAEEIDRLNILQARLLAMKRAVEGLKTVPAAVLVDGHLPIPGLFIEQRAIIDGDVSVLSISCASILAKVTRDNICDSLHAKYPEYGFDQHKGYPTKLHYDRLKQFGPCAEHRKSFEPVRILLDAGRETVLPATKKLL